MAVGGQSRTDAQNEMQGSKNPPRGRLKRRLPKFDDKHLKNRIGDERSEFFCSHLQSFIQPSSPAGATSAMTCVSLFCGRNLENQSTGGGTGSPRARDWNPQSSSCDAAVSATSLIIYHCSILLSCCSPLSDLVSLKSCCCSLSPPCRLSPLARLLPVCSASRHRGSVKVS